MSSAEDNSESRTKHVYLQRHGSQRDFLPDAEQRLEKPRFSALNPSSTIW
jgi:hypothetical protein